MAFGPAERMGGRPNRLFTPGFPRHPLLFVPNLGAFLDVLGPFGALDHPFPLKVLALSNHLIYTVFMFNQNLISNVLLTQSTANTVWATASFCHYRMAKRPGSGLRGDLKS